MNGTQWAGQALLWAGFISAALATTCQREYDFLAQDEKVALKRLPPKLILDKNELASVTSTELSQLSVDELNRVIDDVLPISKRNQSAVETAELEAKRRKEAGEPEPSLEAGDAPKVKSISYAQFEKSRTTLLKDKWPTIPWLWYGLSMAVGLVGVVVLRSNAKSAEQDDGHVAAQFDTVERSLKTLRENISTFGQELDSMSPQNVIDFIDGQCAISYADFAEARGSLIQRFGMQPYAEIMTQFASAERFTNRAWSAGADGYMNEVKDCVARVSAHLEEAQRLVLQYEQDTQS